jgi:hypothetical protein
MRGQNALQLGPFSAKLDTGAKCPRSLEQVVEAEKPVRPLGFAINADYPDRPIALIP